MVYAALCHSNRLRFSSAWTCIYIYIYIYIFFCCVFSSSVCYSNQRSTLGLLLFLHLHQISDYRSTAKEEGDKKRERDREKGERRKKMLPPSDSLAHQNLKLAEVLASIQKQTAAAAAPPPPYAATATTATPVPSNNITAPELLGEFEDDEEDDNLSLAPIVIRIDTSISIDGQNNTVTIPSSSSEDSHSDAQSPVSSIQQLQQLQQRRQAKSAQLASAIISALKSAGALDDRETGRQRPMEVDVNAGIRITGNSNMICPGARKRSSSDLVSGQPDRKRRAQSIPLRGNEYFLARSQLVPEYPRFLFFFAPIFFFSLSTEQSDPTMASVYIQVAQKKPLSIRIRFGVMTIDDGFGIG
ncbi:conserved hypothetical protein [Trichophyton verrucosum HKI 0517]|uniref:Uncharacterized protein n=1 Tax=Trichophyton verrucosum (strain HKI 0517) TaxID=663202 RepID=D4DE52_TRIVH|nr:uncharacterized protein TRV_05417 [Trichophyton verrucosum HKI 0517]EFE39868.1 conserved hypothetical protein [Trichophyton verrucosum HKI 0517]